MSRWGQPSTHVLIEGRSCRLQVLDPETAFALEPQLIERLGEGLCVTLARPAAVTKAMGEILDGESKEASAAESLRQIAAVAASLLAVPNIDGSWVVEVIESVLFDRLTVDGSEVGSWVDWARCGFAPAAKWRALSAQLSQTYGPLWSRSPYSAGQRKGNNYGVPTPNVSRTVKWAAALASSGYVSSVDEVLRTWAPVRMIELVELAAESAEVERRAADAARQGAPC